MTASGYNVKRLDILINIDIVISHGLPASFSYKNHIRTYFKDIITLSLSDP